MSREYIFTNIIIVDSYFELLNKTVSSIINQSINFEQNTQILFYIKNRNYKSKKICENYKKKYPNNIQIINDFAHSNDFILNSFIKGQYLNILKSGSTLNNTLFFDVMNCFNNNTVDLIKISPEKEHFEKIYLNEGYSFGLTNISSIFFNSNLTNNFNLTLENINNVFYIINNILLNIDSYITLYSNSNLINTKDNITLSLDEINVILSENTELPDYIYYNILDFLRDIAQYENNYSDKIKKTVTAISKKIKDTTINNHESDPIFKNYLLSIKYDGLKLNINNTNLELSAGPYIVDEFNHHNIWIYNYDTSANEIILRGFINSYFDNDFLSVSALINEDNITVPCKLIKDQYRKNKQYFGEDFNFSYTFELVLPIKNIKSKTFSLVPTFHINKQVDDFSKDNVIPLNLPIKFSKHSGINTNNYLIKNNNLLEFKNNSFQYDKGYTFSIIIPVYNSENYVRQSISSIVNQNIGFENNVQLILIDDGSTDNSLNILNEFKELYPENIIILSQENKGPSIARNIALPYIKGQYVNFLDSDDYLSENALYEVSNYFNKHDSEIDVVAIPIEYIGNTNENYSSNNLEETKLINLVNQPNYIQKTISSTFIKSKVLLNFKFNENLRYSEGCSLINKILAIKKTIGFLNVPTYYYRKQFNLSELSEKKLFDYYYYTDYLDDFFLDLINYCKNRNEKFPDFIKFLIVNQLKDIVCQEKLDIFPSDEERKTFWNKLYDICAPLNDASTLRNNELDSSLKVIYMYLRFKGFKTTVENDNVLLKTGNYVVDNLNNHNIWIYYSKLFDNKIKLKGFFNSYFNKKNISIKAILFNSKGDFKEFSTIKIDDKYRKDQLVLSKIFKHMYTFEVEIPLEKEDVETLTFKLSYEPNSEKNSISQNGIEKNLDIEFSKHSLIQKDNEYYDTHIVNFKRNSMTFTRRYTFSIIMAIYNTEKYLNESIDSIINQTIGFEDNVQLILVNDGSTDNSLDILKAYQEQYPENIIVLTKENGGQATARNYGLKYTNARFINFLDSDDYLSENALEEVKNFYDKYNNVDLVALPFKQFGRTTQDHRLNFKFKETRLIDLDKEPDKIQLSSQASFIRYEALRGIKFDSKLVASEDAQVVNKVLLNKNNIGVINTAFYHYRRREDFSSTIDMAEKGKDYFNKRLKYYFLDMIGYCLDKKGKIPSFIQYSLAYDLHWMLSVESLDVLDNELEVNEFWYLLKKVIDHLSFNSIYKNPTIKNGLVKSFFLSLKYGVSREIKNDNIILKTGNHKIDDLKVHNIYLDIINIKDGYLNISGFMNSLFDSDYISVLAFKENKDGTIETYTGKKVIYTARQNRVFLSKQWQFKYNFDIQIPLSKIEECNVKIKFIYHIDGDYTNYDSNNIKEFNLPIRFNKHARMSEISDYFESEGHFVHFENNTFKVQPSSYSLIKENELKIIDMIKNSGSYNCKEASRLRWLYLKLYRIFKYIYRNKPIYMFMDRTSVADDNATHLFKYANSQDDNIKKYFILSKKSDDYDKMKKIGNVLEFKSLKHKFISLFADKLITTHPYESRVNPFFDYDSKKDQRHLFAGLVNYKIYFLQHGVTKDNISDWMSKYDKDLSLIVTVSDLERKSFLQEGYNFNENIIQTLGFPRFDNLSNQKDKKQILIAPTWRKNLRSKNLFLNSEYYKSLNNVLSNKKLINMAKEKGYTVVFKPHPELTRIIEGTDERYMDFLDIDENIKIPLSGSYQDLFRDASLLITDYSSVFFDFAYLKKPIIYYQPLDDYHYSESYFDYETMGFGDVIKDKDNLLEKIGYYLENDIEDKYINRIDSFFKYHDKNNRKRVYDWIKTH